MTERVNDVQPIDISQCRDIALDLFSMELLAFFECQCRGVKFYDLRSAGASWGTTLRLIKGDIPSPRSTLCRGLGPRDAW